MALGTHVQTGNRGDGETHPAVTTPGPKALVATPMAHNGNRCVVGQGNRFRTITGPSHATEGEAVVIRRGGGHAPVVARLQVGD